MITRALENCFKKAEQKWWNKTFWGVDIHETIIFPTYEGGKIPKEWYPFAKEALQIMSNRKDITLFLFTCSWPKEIEKYFEFFKEEGIVFEYANENPEVSDNAYGYYRTKPYWNVLFEDKAGFDPVEWPYVLDVLKRYPDKDWSKYETHFDNFLERKQWKETSRSLYWEDEKTMSNMGVDRLVEILRGESSPYKKTPIEKKMEMIHEYLDSKNIKYVSV